MIISALAAIAAAAPFSAPTAFPALSGQPPPIPTGGPPFPPLSNNGSFAQPTGLGRPPRPFASGSLPPFPNGTAILPIGTASMPMGTASMPVGTAPLPIGTAPSLNSTAPLPDGIVSTVAAIPPRPTDDTGFMKRQFAGLSGIASPSGTSDLGGLGSLGSGSGLSGLGSGTGASLPSFSIPAGLTGFGTTGASFPSFSAPAGLSGFGTTGSSGSSLGSSGLSGLSGSSSSINPLDLSSSGLGARGSDAEPLASLATPSNALSASPPSAVEAVNAPLDGPAAAI